MSELVKPVSLEDREALAFALPDLFGWLCGYCSKVDVRLNSILWKKFKDGCPGCHKLKDCDCPVITLEETPLKTIRGKRKRKTAENHPTITLYAQPPPTIEGWQELLKGLYGTRNSERKPVVLLSKLTEDIGMVAKSIRQRLDRSKVESHVSSVFAWTVALATRLKMDFLSIVWKKYEKGCPICFSIPCKCSPLSSVFISYASDVEDKMNITKELINKYKLTPRVFPLFDVDFTKGGPMVKAFEEIQKSDAAIVILGGKHSIYVQMEYYYLMSRMNKSNVLVFIDSKEKREPGLQELIENIRHVHRYIEFTSPEDLIFKIEEELTRIIKAAQPTTR